MPKSDATDTGLIRAALVKAGLTVADVPEGKDESCDLRATDVAHEGYLFEVKGFHDDEEIPPVLRRGDLYEKSLPFDKGNAIEVGLDKATSQLKSTAAGFPDYLRLVALLVRSRYDQKVKYHQILAELCGKRSIIIATDVPGKGDHLECFYFSHSAFFRHRRVLDGAVLFDGDDGFALFANAYGSRAARLCQSALGQFFAQHGAMMDNATLERDGYLIADCNLDRSDEGAMLRWVAQKYNLRKPIVVGFQRYSAMARVDYSATRNAG